MRNNINLFYSFVKPSRALIGATVPALGLIGTNSCPLLLMAAARVILPSIGLLLLAAAGIFSAVRGCCAGLIGPGLCFCRFLRVLRF